MEKRIRGRMFLVGLISLLISTLMLVYVFQTALDDQVEGDVKQACELIAHGYEYTDDPEYLKTVLGPGEDLRLTVISHEGEVLYESDAEGPMENHMDREEVRQAMENGWGEAVRTSMTLGYDTYYYAVRLDDGMVLRVGLEVDSMHNVYDQILPSLAAAIFLVVIAAFLLSLRLTQALVDSITSMAESIDTIQENIPYKELQPFADAVAQQRDKERENQRIRQEFTANVSHELKTPLTSISGYAEMIEMGMVREDDTREFGSRIRKESGRLLHLIADILRLGELDSPVHEVQKESIQLHQTAQFAVERLQLQAQKAYVMVKTQLEPVSVWGDETMISEVCYNLCDNAIRYNRPGGTVWITVTREGKEAKLVVKDTGIGIPKEAQDRIFERFYRVDKSRSKETGGTGLGLAIVKHAVAQNGGRIQLSSELGVGTEITVYLPMDPQNV
ncbi:MAG: two-component sensor histidine kinase [Firmicutes bacterium]|nr:two-component sensor histidine kinase [Bacillota bacterium]